LPLSVRARIEVYLPDLPRPEYRELLSILRREFTHSFGGCTIAHGLDGSYLSDSGQMVTDTVSLVYVDAGFDPDESLEILSLYTDKLRETVNEFLEEEAILVAVLRVRHSSPTITEFSEG
jgi:hypothetical protein